MATNGRPDFNPSPESRLLFSPKIEIFGDLQNFVTMSNLGCRRVGKNSLYPVNLKSRSDVAERTNYQKNIIRNYYENRENISLQRVQELVTELYLSEGKKRQKYWQSLGNHLSKLDVKQQTIDNLIEQDDPQLAAQLIQKLAGQD